MLVLLTGVSLLLCAEVVIADPITVSVPGKTITLDTERWRKLDDEATYALNYEEMTADPTHVYKRIVTIYLLPMSQDRRQGLKISGDEYIEFFVAHIGAATLQTRLDRGRYWVLCRETLRVPDSLQSSVQKLQHSMSEEDQHVFWQAMQDHVDDTRYLLRRVF